MWGFIKNLKELFVGHDTPDIDPLHQSTVKPQTVVTDITLRPYKTNSANQNAQNELPAAGSIWVGMSINQLLQSIGPALTKQYRGSREIWTYLNLHGQGTKTAVAIENGTVIHWQDMLTNAYTPVKSPAAR